MDLELRNKRVIITGGSRGIGKVVARELASEGARVAIAARNLEIATATADEIAKATGSEVFALKCDTGSNEDVKAMVEAAVSRLGGVDVLINNAGRPGNLEVPPKLSEITDEMVLPEINVKVLGYLRCAREVVPHMVKQGGGRIINVIGLSARYTGSTIHSMRNVAIVAMTKNLSDELGSQGITVVGIHPGQTRTEAIPGAIRAKAQREGISEADLERRLGSVYALGRLLEMPEVAWVITFLASPKAISLNGDTVVASGGAKGWAYY